mgnify:CR=1 FL=1
MKQDVEIKAETINASWSTWSLKSDKKAEFENELQQLLKKYNFIIYAANVLVEWWEVIPSIRIVENTFVQNEDGNKKEEVITVA